jgi:hypothetical protein
VSDKLAKFQITVEGWLDETMADYLGDLQLSSQLSQGIVRETTVEGQVPDFGAFLSAVTHIWDMGVNVRSVKYQAPVAESEQNAQDNATSSQRLEPSSVASAKDREQAK